MTVMTNVFYKNERETKYRAVDITPYSNKISGKIISRDLMSISWVTLPDNLPATNGNLLAVWQNTGIPWGQGAKPIQKATISENSQYGDQVFSFEIQRKPYVVAFATSDTGSAFCASLQFYPGNPDGVDSITTISLVTDALGNNSLIASFVTPPGNNPKANKNWLGLWQGTKVTYDGSNMIKKVDIDSAFASDDQSMNGLDLTVNTTYTLGYACGPKNSDLTAFVTFTTAAY